MGQDPRCWERAQERRWESANEIGHSPQCGRLQHHIQQAVVSPFRCQRTFQRTFKQSLHAFHVSVEKRLGPARVPGKKNPERALRVPFKRVLDQTKELVRVQHVVRVDHKREERAVVVAGCQRDHELDQGRLTRVRFHNGVRQCAVGGQDHSERVGHGGVGPSQDVERRHKQLVGERVDVGEQRLDHAVAAVEQRRGVHRGHVQMVRIVVHQVEDEGCAPEFDGADQQCLGVKGKQVEYRVGRSGAEGELDSSNGQVVHGELGAPPGLEKGDHVKRSVGQDQLECRDDARVEQTGERQIVVHVRVVEEEQHGTWGARPEVDPHGVLGRGTGIPGGLLGILLREQKIRNVPPPVDECCAQQRGPVRPDHSARLFHNLVETADRVEVAVRAGRVERLDLDLFRLSQKSSNLGLLFPLRQLDRCPPVRVFG